MPDYIENIFMLMKLVSSEETIAQYKEAYENAAIRYGDMKKQLAEDMVSFIAPIREKANELLGDENRLQEIMRQGAEKSEIERCRYHEGSAGSYGFYILSYEWQVMGWFSAISMLFDCLIFINQISFFNSYYLSI